MKLVLGLLEGVESSRYLGELAGVTVDQRLDLFDTLEHEQALRPQGDACQLGG